MKSSAPERNPGDQGEFDPDGSTVPAFAGTGIAANFFTQGRTTSCKGLFGADRCRSVPNDGVIAPK
jgi:hypothetical protein